MWAKFSELLQASYYCSKGCPETDRCVLALSETYYGRRELAFSAQRLGQRSLAIILKGWLECRPSVFAGRYMRFHDIFGRDIFYIYNHHLAALKALLYPLKPLFIHGEFQVRTQEQSVVVDVRVPKKTLGLYTILPERGLRSEHFF